MNKIYALIILYFGFITAITAQINTGILPESIRNKMPIENTDQLNLSPPSIETIKAEDIEDEKNGQMMKVARLIPVDASIENSGTWERTPEGRNIWRLRISSDGALACVLHFSDFSLPTGSELFVYNPDKSVILGPYTSSDNDDGGSYAIGVVYGKELIIEYATPNVKSENGINNVEMPIIEMSNYSYFYRGVEFFDYRGTGYGASESCQVNANCSEGNNWRTQQKGVARIYVVEDNSGGYCTGTLINNTANNQTPYFLTADHCGGTATTSELGQWIFRFNYESPGCVATSQPSGNSINGCTRKSRAPLNGGSDFLLLQLNTTATNLKNIGAVYNGWRNTTAASPSGVSIHHPSGDIKKISTYTSTLSTTSYNGGTGNMGATNAHWRVYWAATTNGHGVTEQGSSGSPIFDNNGLVVGTLSGGSSYCEATSSPDLYGKMSYHWTTNGTTSAEQLKPWLDPSGTATTCEFLDPNNLGLVCNFSGTPTSVTTGGTVTFTDLSSGGTITGRSWSFPGGSPASSTAVSPVITYNTAGTYNVTLTVNSSTSNDAETKTGYITVTNPGSGFTYDFEACANFVVDQFSPCTTYDGDQKTSFGSEDYTFNNEGYTGSFIAFNPSATTPAAGASWAPHGGAKYGACFDATTGANNDWFITPKINLQSNSSFSFWAKSLTEQWGKERFNVYISTTNNNISSFTKISTGTYLEAPTTWTKFNYALAAYNNQDVYLAIQCVSNNAFVFMIDDIVVSTEQVVTPPIANFSGTPTTVTTGGTVTFTDLSTGGAVTSRSWSFPGGSPASSTAASPIITYNTAGTYNVTLTVYSGNLNSTETKTGYITVTNVASGFTYDFEACTNFAVDQFSPCTTYDGDQQTTFGIENVSFSNANYKGSFIAFNPSATSPALGTSWTAHGGNKYGACFAATSGANNDWFITPSITLQSNSSFSFWAKSITAEYGLERFNVYVSTTNNNIGSFTKISSGSYIEAPVSWTQYNYNLSSYNNQNIYIAIQCVSSNAFTFMIDDIVVSTEGSSVSPPVANFYGTPTSGCKPLTVNFYDQSTNNPTSRLWSFPGGTPSTSTSQNPIVVYNSAGLFDVTLKATNAGGNNTYTRTSYITITDCSPVFDEISSKVSVFPNPTDGILNINIPENSAIVKVNNIIGKEVKSFKLNANENVIDLNSLSPGMYFIEIQLSETKITTKVTVR